MKSLATIRSEESSDWHTNAEFYQADEDALLMGALARRRERYYDIQPGQRVLDVGCGAGGTVVRLRARGVDAVGVDYAAAMIEVAQREYGLHGHVHCASATDLPFDSNSFDVVIANGVFHHLAVQQRLGEALSEIRRVLRPGGRMCCFDRNGSVVSGLLSGFCVRLKEVLRALTGRERFPSCASRNEVAFGGRRDLRTLRDYGFVLARRQDVSTVPFFLSVVTLNTIQYFLSERARRFVERRLLRPASWFDAHCPYHWFSVEQFAVFVLESDRGAAVGAQRPEHVKQRPSGRRRFGAEAVIPA